MASGQTDPGVRGGTAGAGGAIAGLTVKEGKFFSAGQQSFAEAESVSEGLGPRFNLDSCVGCHAAPAAGGSSPAVNPQVTAAPADQVSLLTGLGLISANGPVREIRFKSDGGVHALFTIMGRSDAPAGCKISQPDFSGHRSEIVFRIPTPTFGSGLIEAISEWTIWQNETATKPFGITGHANRNGNDGTMTRFGWKAQNKSLVTFSGEAYNVEMGVSNEVFPNERGESGYEDPIACMTPYPNDHTNYELTQPQSVVSDAIAFANYMRFLAPPAPVSSYGQVTAASINHGKAVFSTVGCAVCHIPSMTTSYHATAALANKTANLYSDLLVHNMGMLGDGVTQGNAGPNDFRTAPLWGLGQRIFFLHDGRTTDLVEAIGAHALTGSEAITVIDNYNALSTGDKQDLLNFLRSL